MASQPRAKDYDHLVKLLLIGDSGERRDERKRKEEAREKTQFFFKCSRSLNLATQFQSKTSSLLSLQKGVGKSCLLLRFSDDSFTSSFITTIG